jgi:DNA-binding response OmpR family regulator
VGSPKKILILDDDPWLLKELGAALENAGYVVLASRNVDGAVQALAQHPDFAIVDLFLDGEVGSELSNNFIRDNLVPAAIPYARLTSAPPSSAGNGCFINATFSTTRRAS